jgi:hypothetical protein
LPLNVSSSGFFHLIGIGRQSYASQDRDDRNDNHHFNQRKANDPASQFSRHHCCATPVLEIANKGNCLQYNNCTSIEANSTPHETIRLAACLPGGQEGIGEQRNI